MVEIFLKPVGYGLFTGNVGVHGTTFAWDAVNDEIDYPDEYETYIYQGGGNYFNIDSYFRLEQAHVVGTISAVKIYFRCAANPGYNAQAEPGLYLNGTLLYGSAVSISGSFASHSQAIPRPGGGSFTWSDINNLQAVIEMWMGYGSASSVCTQVYVGVTYDPTTGVVETDDIEYITETWVLASVLAYSLGNPLYVGVEWWLDPNYPHINWYNPPGGSTKIISNRECKINIGGLQGGQTYSWRAYGTDDDGNIYTGNTETFTTTAVPIPIPPTPLYGLGRDYKTALIAISEVAKLGLGRFYVDTEGNVQYESRIARNA